MRCVIPKAHLKIFARAVHSLAKIGDDLYLDAGEGGLAISTINSSRSAYATYSFRAAFFSSYEPPPVRMSRVIDLMTINQCLGTLTRG